MKNLIYISILVSLLSYSNEDDSQTVGELGSIFFIAFSPASLDNSIPNDVAEISNKLVKLENGQLENPISWGKLGISEGLSELYPETVYGVKCSENTTCFGDYTNLEFYRSLEESPLESETIEKELYYLIKQVNNTVDTLRINVVQTYQPFTVDFTVDLNGEEIDKIFYEVDGLVYDEFYVKVLK
ncbi:MAG: hypothetical protein ACJAX3_001116 [Patiriisocius sp.]|jgi:hypothetical protein